MIAIETTASSVVSSAIKVHRALGAGLLESAYQACLTYELRSAGHVVKCEVPTPVHYRGIVVEAGYRIDMLVNDHLLIENKSVERILPIHVAQILTYLKLSDLRVGFILNWNVMLLRDGIKRVVRGF